MSFSKNFLWGASTSSAQIEGAWDVDGKIPSIWDVAGDRIENGHTCHTACDHYHHYKEDVALMKELGLKSYRFSISWPRIMSEKRNVNPLGVSFYQDLVRELRAANIEPLVTLFHWDLPVWVQEIGGWAAPEVVELYLDYVRTMVDALSDQVTYWMTFNEPQMFCGLGYRDGVFAPFIKDEVIFKRAVRHMLLSHGKAVRLIRDTAKTKPVIGIATAASAYIPDEETPEGLARAAKETFASPFGETINALYDDPMLLGKASPTMKGELSAEDLQIICQPLDFLGMNVYQPSNVQYASYDAEKVRRPKTMMDWVIDGRCLYWTPRQFYERYHVPIMITENGMANPDLVGEDGKVHDAIRIGFLAEYLTELRRAADEGIPILGYQHWALLDNFEWLDGYAPRFGLIHVDYTTQMRTIKDAGYAYAEIIRTNGEALLKPAEAAQQ